MNRLPGEEPCWHPAYPVRLSDGREVFAEITDIGEPECPVSIISRFPKMDMLVTEIISAGCVKEASGAVPFGTDSAKWPARWHDAVKIAEIENRRVEAARDKLREQSRS